MIRKDLIEKELNEHGGFENFKQVKLCKNQIDTLLKKNKAIETCEFFYDDDINVDEIENGDELYNMYMDYEYIYITKENKKQIYSKKKYSKQELKEAYDKIMSIYNSKEYKERKLTFNNWIEPYFEGNWNMSQEYVDEKTKSILLDFIGKKNKERVYIHREDNSIHIYIYARDIYDMDYWIILAKREGE